MKKILSYALVSYLSFLYAQPFHAWDIGHAYDRIIQTKIAGKEFTLITDIGANADYRLYDRDNDKNLTPWKRFDPKSDTYLNKAEGTFYIKFNVDKARKNVSVQFRFCQSKDAPGIPVPLKNCENNSGGSGSGGVSTSYGSTGGSGNVTNSGVSGSWSTTTSYGGVSVGGSAGTEYEYNISTYSDNFAIRPEKFKFTIIPLKIKAGEDFNVTIEALDYNGDPTIDYNETISLNKSPEINLSITKNGCKNGNLKIVDGEKFKNGKAVLTLSYDNVGDFNASIKEVLGNEFAKVDEKDTPDKKRFISSDDANLTIIPHHFSFSSEFYNYKNKSFTYMANDLNMSSVLEINITAKTKDDKTATNYNSKCYAKNFDLEISHSKIKNDYIYYRLTTDEKNSTKDENITLTNLSKDYFSTDHNGTAHLEIYITLSKDYKIPLSEENFTLNNVKVVDADGAEGIGDINKSSLFRYGRIDIKDVSTYGNEANTSFVYEYWTDSEGWKVNKLHTSLYGEVNNSKSIKPGVKVNLDKIKNGIENVNIKTEHALPYTTKIHLAIPEYLWYHPLAKNYEDPSKDNLDCLTHPCLRVSFNTSSRGWGGIGIHSNTYSESNRTVEINVTSDTQVNKSQVRKFNW